MTLAVEPSRLWASRALHPFHLQHNTRRAACHEHTLSHQRTTAQWNVILHRNEHFTSNHMRRCWSRFIKPSVTRTYSVCSTGKPFASHVGGVEKLLVIILTESICLRRAPHLVLIRPLHFNSALNLHPDSWLTRCTIRSELNHFLLKAFLENCEKCFLYFPSVRLSYIYSDAPPGSLEGHDLSDLVSDDVSSSSSWSTHTFLTLSGGFHSHIQQS